ncbi:uncharacterized protein [Panulirus ornatus]|uniref:uncharacterized protein n=1 Tax=Panulirus ornatus TaxID=150431 RepID=UPI003A88EE7D
MAACSLRKVVGKELPVLKKKLEGYLPGSAIVHGTIELGIKYGLLEKLGTKIYVPEAPKPSSLVVATPAFSTKKIQSLSVFWNTEEEDDEEVAQLLRSLPEWDWKKSVFFSCGPKAISNKLEQMANDKYLGDGQVVARRCDDSYLHLYDKETPIAINR